jgi:sugar-specific transcriptional regulator TrmB
MDIQLLEKIGLKEREARVYLALLQRGPSLANPLAKLTHIVRSSIYDYLNILLEKGFVSYFIKNGKKYFQAIPPERIIDKFREEKSNEEEAILNAVSEIKKFQHIYQSETDVEVFEGKEGLKSAFSLVLKEKPAEILVHGSSGISYKVLPFFMEHWHEERVRLGIPMRIIFNDVPEAHERIKKGPPMELMKHKFSSMKNLSLIGTLIFRDNILIHILYPKAPVGIIIKNKDLSEVYRKEFALLWKNAHR